MRKFLVYLLILPLFSCDDFLTVESENDVTFVNYFKTESDVELVVIDMMAAELQLWGLMTYSNLSFLDLAALPCDEYENENVRNLNVGVFTDPAKMESWGGYYALIGKADVLLENASRFTGITDERKEFWLAQACFMKAFAYFEIARKWGDAPISPGAEAKDPLAKSPAKEVLETAIQYAEKALVLPQYDQLTDSYGNSLTSKQYASSGTVKTLLANIYAWMGGLYKEKTYWEKAEQYASDVIEGKCGAYRLEPDIAALKARTLGEGRESDETIFAIEVTSKDYEYEGNSYMPMYLYPSILLCTYPYFSLLPSDIDGPGVGYTRISVETVEDMYPEEEDVRRDSFWYHLGTQTLYEDDDTPSPWAYFVKWNKVITSVAVGNEGKIISVEGNKVIWRLADLKLLRAECRTRLNMPNAVEDLNDVRERAGLEKYDGPTGSEVLREEVFNERERELFGEGQRYFDIVRNGYLNRLSLAYSMLTQEEIDRGALYLPVGEKAFVNNELMTQNSYWLWKK